VNRVGDISIVRQNLLKRIFLCVGIFHIQVIILPLLRYRIPDDVLTLLIHSKGSSTTRLAFGATSNDAAIIKKENTHER